MTRFAAFLAFALLVPAPLLADTSPALSDAANQAYLHANAARAGVVTRPDGLQYRILASGFGKRPSINDTVQIAFSGRLIDGTVFDGSSPGLPTTVPLNILIRGVNEAIQMMHEGDHWQLVMPANLGFGPNSADNGAIPPNQTLVFDVTLVSVLAAPPPQDAGTPFPFGITGSSRGTEAQGHAFLSIPE